MTTQPPPWARPSHHHLTPRLILRTGTVSDARAFTQIRSDPLNSEFGGVVNATASLEQSERNLAKQAATTAEGKNAWVVVVLKEGGVGEEKRAEPGVESLRVSDGWLIGCSGFNSFPLETSQCEGGGKEEVLVGDAGVLIDHHFLRKGYALETLQKLVEVGFGELGVDVVFLETNYGNEPFRGLMRKLGVGDTEREGGGDGSGGRSLVFRFGREKWEGCKRGLRESGRWYL